MQADAASTFQQLTSRNNERHKSQKTQAGTVEETVEDR
jgi:hypothetical protein